MLSVKWENNQVVMIDQNKLPHSYELIETRDLHRIADEIYKLGIRGGPAIGVTVAYGMAIAAQDSEGKSPEEILKNLENAKNILNVRPTASNLVWGLEHMENYAKKLLENAPSNNFGDLMVKEAQRLADNEIETNLKMAEFGMQVIPDNANIVTQCNTGALCTVGIGHVMGTVFYAHQKGKKLHVYTDETRPRLQGAKLNVFELDLNKVPYTLITDNTAAYLMQLGKIDMVMVGADRMVANGDAAAKIGVYMLAVLAHYHKIPFYMFATTATIDMKTETGVGIEIEERDAEEVTVIDGVQITIPNANVLNYAFDVTPHELYTAIITERGIIIPPFKENIKKLLEN